MRLHELIPQVSDLVVHNEDCGQTVVLTPQGAVYDNEWTDDLTNMSVAFGMLITSDQWRVATKEEIDALREEEKESLMELNWKAPTRKKPVLSVVHTEK